MTSFYLMVKCGSLCLAMVTDTIKSDESFIPKNKKNIKIWFSPKSRKVRCCIEKPVGLNKSNEVQGKKANTSPSSKDLSVYNFTSSSQESGSSSPPRGKANKKIKKKRISQTCKQTGGALRPKTWTQTMQECKRLELEAINQQWAFGKEGAIDKNDKEDEKVSSGDDNRRSSKRVTFHFPHRQPEETHKTVHQEQNQIPSPQKSIPSYLEFEGTEKQSSAVLSSPYYDQQVEPVTDIPQESNENTPAPPQPSLARVRKRAREDQDSEDPQRMPKQLRTTSRWKKRSSREVAASTEDRSRRLRTSRQSNEKQNVNPITPATPDLERKSSSGRHKQTNPACMKRNLNGETPLHLAAIKVCVICMLAK